MPQVGHGFNLLGLPGDLSPPSRFIRLFYARQFAVLNAPPHSLNESLSLTSAILNGMMIPKGAVASATTSEPLEFTQYSVLKVPGARQFYFKDYDNTRWRLVRLEALDFSPAATKGAEHVSLADGTLGVEDVTGHLASRAGRH